MRNPDWVALKVEVGRSRAGLGIGWGCSVGILREPVGGVVVGEGVVVGGGGGVFVGGVGAWIGVEEGYSGFYGVFGVAGLVEGLIGRVGEGCGDGEGEDCGRDGFEFEWGECEGDGEG